MAFCANCGATVSGAGFCGSCGRPLAAAAPPAQMASAPHAAGMAAAPTMQTVPAGGAAASGLTPNVAGALSYLLGFITGIIFLVLEPYKRDPFVRFHAMQSILLSAGYIVFHIAWGMLVSAVATVGGFLVLVLVPIGFVISLCLFSFWLFLMYQAYKGNQFRIPFIGAIAAKQVGR